MAFIFLGYTREVQDLFALRHLVPGEDLGVGSASGTLLSWPVLREGEQYLVGMNHSGMYELFYAVEAIQDVNDLIARRSDILYGKLRIYVATRKSSS